MLLKDELTTFRANGRFRRTQCLRLNSPKMLRASYRCIKLMKSYEQFFATPYDDQFGKNMGVWCRGATIGYGHLIKDTNEFKQYINGISESEATVLFEKDLYRFIQSIKHNVTVDLTQHEFDALVMLAFNTGVTGFKQSTVLRIINGDNTKNLRQAWLSFRYSQGRIMQGLINRRKSELRIFFDGVYVKL